MRAHISLSAAEKRWLTVLGTLNELQARPSAPELRRGGVSRTARLTGVSHPTTTKEAAPLRDAGPPRPSRERMRGARPRRRKVEDVTPGIESQLPRISEETTAADPVHVLNWTKRRRARLPVDQTPIPLLRRSCSMSIIPGLSPLFINNAAALLINGHIEYACEEERLNRENKPNRPGMYSPTLPLYLGVQPNREGNVTTSGGSGKIRALA